MHFDDHTIELAVVGPATGVRIGKRFSIEGARLTIRCSLENPGHAALPHLFKMDSQFRGNLLDAVDEQPWPTSIDLSRCRDQTTRSNEVVYVSDLPEGWCGITDTKAGSWFRIDDPRDVFPYCWIFMSYGAWRYHNVVVLELCSNYPRDLNEAIATGKAAALAPSSTTEFQLQVSVGAR